MQTHDVRPAPGSRHKRKRVGRGNASGHGTYSGRGIKGQKARSGNDLRPGFEGGQMPLIRRVAKRGFNNARFRTEYEAINLSRLAKFEANAEVTPESLLAAGIVRDDKKPVKIMGDGDLDRPLRVRAHKFTASARRKIEEAGGTVEEMGLAAG
ncbi:MAG TPA: 50S ribosomal protein L15 [Dehalococcoidia bacterium]